MTHNGVSMIQQDGTMECFPTGKVNPLRLEQGTADACGVTKMWAKNPRTNGICHSRTVYSAPATQSLC